MKFAYFYVSSPIITNPEDLTFPPEPPILSVECGEFPKKIDVALNIAVVGIDGVAEPNDEYSLEIDIFCGDVKVESYKNIYEPFRAFHVLSSDNNLASRFSFIDTFTVSNSGIYTFIARLYDGAVPLAAEDKKSYIDKIECSVAIAKGWK